MSSLGARAFRRSAFERARFPASTLFIGAFVCALVARAFTPQVSPLLVLAGAWLAVAVLRHWPIVFWAAPLTAAVLLDRWVHTTVVVQLHGFSVYASDVLVLYLCAGALLGGLRPVREAVASRPFLFAWALLAIVVIEFLRTIAQRGFGPAVQARDLLPFAVLGVLPLSRRFVEIPARRIVAVLSLAMVALATDAVVRLASGFETTTRLGVQRIYQTWEPFIAGATGLALLVYILRAKRAPTLAYVGFAASVVPVVFSFFRIAWALFAVIGVAAFVLFRSGKRQKQLAVLVAVLGAAFLIAGSIGSARGPSYVSQIVKRASEMRPTLDKDRSREYVAVWAQIRKDPLAGSGFDTQFVGSWTTYRTGAHNAYEWIWWRLGAFGLGTLLALVITAGYAGVKASRRLAGEDGALAAGLVAALLFVAVAANFHANFDHYQSNLFNALVLAQLIVLGARAQPAP